MRKTALVRARVDEQLKNEAAQILAESGLTISSFIRLALEKVVAEKALPLNMNSKQK